MVSVDAGFGQPQPLHWPTVHEVFPDNFFRVSGVHKPIPDGFRVHDEHSAMLALIQATGLIHAHAMFQTGNLDGVFQSSAQLFRVLVGATGTRSGLVALVHTNKKVVFIIRHPGSPVSLWMHPLQRRCTGYPRTGLPHLRE